MGRDRIENRLPLGSESATLAFGKAFAAQLAPNSILALHGDLGAGKTTFVKGLALGLGIEEPIVSPTFVYLNLYAGRLPLYHFDLYRLKSKEDFEALGFSEYFFKGGICAIEWPERIEIPETAIHLHFIHERNGRTVLY
ncbi:MAG: tRNA (adenosine(37)-N6)-threonylcarbamoyltransferase complex ATPase subunit type 1 TsaE [Chlamydiia bacterium]|nr:tRNA (adenosine(37)-N6)-threonylcarbamoyltransferase complex ATPase subunit type 1 TsaE [Chlamydiia bacterium]